MKLIIAAIIMTMAAIATPRTAAKAEDVTLDRLEP